MKIKIKIQLLLYGPVLCCLAGCKEKKQEYQLSIIETKVLDSIPSGSGIVLKNDTAYIIGDDATGIYRLMTGSLTHQKIPLKGLNDDLYREEKLIKHDFESASFVSWNGNEYLLAFGSGSNATTRDSMLMVRADNLYENRIISLKKYYSRLQQLTQTSSSEWNIEGATVIRDYLILLNRGNNMIIKTKLDELMSYLVEDSSTFPATSYNRVQLPRIQDHEARLSGACTLDNEHILISASVEDTPGWTKDGPVLGSFIAVYSFRRNNIVGCCLLQSQTGEALKEKIESLDILQNNPKDVFIIAVGDNDNGTSVLFRLKLSKS